jgi:hypothetical protein
VPGRREAKTKSKEGAAQQRRSPADKPHQSSTADVSCVAVCGSPINPQHAPPAHQERAARNSLQPFSPSVCRGWVAGAAMHEAGGRQPLARQPLGFWTSAACVKYRVRAGAQAQQRGRTWASVGQKQKQTKTKASHASTHTVRAAVSAPLASRIKFFCPRTIRISPFVRSSQQIV